MKNNKNTKYTEEEIKEATKYAKRDMIMEYGPYIIIILFIILIRTFIATPVRVNGSSMFPTLHDKDTMILYKLTKKFKGINRFDIVVVKTDSGRLIKRVIGLPGETVKYEIVEEDGITTGVLYVDGKVVKEEFIDMAAKAKTCYSNSNICSEDGIKIPDGEYFVMGDNRGDSKDSRLIGPLTFDNILGTSNIIIFPFSRIGKAE